jgi:hypothetical protein
MFQKMFTAYYMNWDDAKDASVYSMGNGKYKVEIEDMRESLVVQTMWFSGDYASHTANQFAARTLGLMEEVAKLARYEAWCREYDAEVAKTLRSMLLEEGECRLQDRQRAQADDDGMRI